MKTTLLTETTGKEAMQISKQISCKNNRHLLVALAEALVGI